MDQKTYDVGMKMRRQVAGNEYVDKAMANVDDFNRDFQRIVTQYCWGEAWGDDTLPPRERSILNLGMIACLGRMEEFQTHVRGALNNGMTPNEIRAVLIQIAVYCGIPVGVDCFRHAKPGDRGASEEEIAHMLDQPDKRRARGQSQGPALDFQEHLAALEAQGLVVRVDRPIDKDTELHPLVRWQFVGGLPEDERRAFLFTNVVDGSGRKYDMPVVVGALSAIAAHLRHRHGQAGRGDRPGLDRRDRHPIAPVRVNSRAVPGGRDQGRRAEEARTAGLKLLPVPISTPGFDAAPYLTATLCVTKDPGDRHPEHGHLSRRR